MTKNIKPEWMKVELLHSERWEDEGGTTVGMEVPHVHITGRFVRPLLKTAGLSDIPRQWRRGLVIEPIQAGMAVGSLKRDAASTE
jgi:hypothetical protein